MRKNLQERTDYKIVEGTNRFQEPAPAQINAEEFQLPSRGNGELTGVGSGKPGGPHLVWTNWTTQCIMLL